MSTHPFITIPKRITGREELVVLSRWQLDKLLAEKTVSEKEILNWSREAKKFKQKGKLPVLRSLKTWR